MDNIPTQLDIKSPIFTPRPGWGGKLNNWFKSNFERKILPALATVIIVIGAYFYIAKHNPAQAPVENSPVAEAIDVQIQSGQGLTHIARTAITEYLSGNGLDLSATQKVFAESYLVNKMGNQRLLAGGTLSIKTTELEEVIEKAKSLTQDQIKTWSRYVH